MSKSTNAYKLAIGLAAVSALVIGPVSAASAFEQNDGTRTCAAPRSVGTFSTSPSGNVGHRHNTLQKTWTNSGSGTTYRYWNYGLSGVAVTYVITSSTSLASAGTVCDT